MSLFRAFALAILLGFALAIGLMIWNRPDTGSAAAVMAEPELAAHRLAGDVSVSEQIAVGTLSSVRAKGFRSIIDLRPDGEVPDQPASTLIRSAAETQGLKFAYIPVPHGDIPEAAIEEMTRTLASIERPVLIYCRSGKRAARTWALAEARRPGGMGPIAIADAVRAAGQPVDDIAAKIEASVAARGKVN